MPLPEPRVLDHHRSQDKGEPAAPPAGVELPPALRADLLDPGRWQSGLAQYARATHLAVALVDAAGGLIGEILNPQPTWRFLYAEPPSPDERGTRNEERGTRQTSGPDLVPRSSFLVPGCPFSPAPLPHDPACHCAADALARDGVVVASDRTGLVHFAVPLVLGEQPLGALVAGQVFDQYPEQLPLEQVAKRLGLSPASVWQRARLEHPIKRATLEVYAELLATLGQTFLQARYHTLIEAERFAEITRLRDHALAETTQRLRVEHAAHERERRIAQVLQRPLLLKVAEDAITGFSLATFYEPALAEAEVGGDFLDIFTLPNGHAALVVGDASGKGVEAAAHNTHVKDVLRAFLREDPGHPGAVLGRVNRTVYGTLHTLDPADLETFIVVALLVVDPLTGEAIYASAGAEPLLVVRSGGEAEAVARPAPALGMRLSTRCEESPVCLQPGDTALLLTDGITEARHGGKLLGYPGMVQLAQQALQAPLLHDAGEAILAGARAFAGGRLSDDACLILARRR